MIALTIDGVAVLTTPGKTLFEAAREASLYIPALCTYPHIPSARGVVARAVVYRGRQPVVGEESGKEFAGCGLCIVEIEGREGLPLACLTPVAEGIVVRTLTARIQQQRRLRLEALLSHHPHICWSCAQREGCSLTLCSSGIPEDERCCPLFRRCELRKLAEFVGIKNIPRYIPRHLPVITEEPLLIQDYNLCIGCLRCVRVCQDYRGRGALGFVFQDDQVLVGSIAPTLKQSGCNFCGACIEVCPAGAFQDKKARSGQRRRERLKLTAPFLPPEDWLPLTAAQIDKVPEQEGVYQLLDREKSLLLIKGTANLRQELRQQLQSNASASYFLWETASLYTSRESQLLQQFLHQQGKLPPQNDELGDLLR